jgi:hypothetical protein
MTETLERHCDLCGALQDEVIGFADKDAGTYPVRAGWVCWVCWPKEGSWHRAILRERTLHKAFSSPPAGGGAKHRQ